MKSLFGDIVTVISFGSDKRKIWMRPITILAFLLASPSVFALSFNSGTFSFDGGDPAYADLGAADYADIIIKIPEKEVCTANNADKASCYQKFCEAQRAGDYQADPSGPACVSK